MNKGINIYRTFLLFFFLVVHFFVCCQASAEKVSENKTLIRSDSLLIATNTKGNTTRYDYVDETGNITYAADKHYATRVQTKSDDAVLEEYYDAEGRPVKQRLGHYALFMDYNEKGQINRLIYLDSDGQPIMNYDGYAIAERYYNDTGLFETEFYFDNLGKPVTTHSFGNGCKRIYDDEGNITAYIFIDADGRPAKTAKGYAIIHVIYYTEGENTGKIKEEHYCDENDKPIKLSNNQYGLYKEYDEFGRANRITCLDIDGKPTINADGYAICRRSFYADDSIHTETYYDKEGNPIALGEGQYGILYQDGKILYLDINGCELFNIKNTLHNNHLAMIIMGIFAITVPMFSNKKANTVFFVLYLLIIIYFTMMFRNHLDRKMELRLFWSYKQFFSNEQIRWQIIENILLFVPLGIIMYKSYLLREKALFIIFILSIVIEIIQYMSGFGLCELDDVLSNSIGGYTGYIIAKLTEQVVSRIKS